MHGCRSFTQVSSKMEIIQIVINKFMDREMQDSCNWILFSNKKRISYGHTKKFG